MSDRLRWFPPSAVIVLLVFVLALLTGEVSFGTVYFLGAGWVVWLYATAGLIIWDKWHGQSAFRSVRWTAPIVAVLVLGSVVTTSYNSLKTSLNGLPLWADPILAEIDLSLFGWMYQPQLASYHAVTFYHVVWGFTLIFTLAAVALRRNANALLLGYFILWGILAPVVQALLPSGGPIFYERLGHGDLFADYDFQPSIVHASNYLWGIYAQGEQGFSSGISAMPSLHVASATWIALAWRGTKLFGFAVVSASFIFILSVVLGWHYAIDGIVGAGLAVASVRLAALWLSKPISIGGLRRVTDAAKGHFNVGQQAPPN